MIKNVSLGTAGDFNSYGLSAVGPDWAISERFWQQRYPQNLPKYLVNSDGLFLKKNAADTLQASFGQIVLLFIPASGHTEC